MRLTANLKNILIARLQDAHGGSVEAFHEYTEYADSVIIDWNLFETYNDGIAALVNDYGKTVIY